MATPKYLECNLCGNQQPYEPFVPAVCKQCDSQWLEARYDYDAFKREILRGLPSRPSNMWRYSAKDITPEERKRLNGHIEALYQKGPLPTRKFVDQVINVIEEANETPEGERGI